MVSSNAWKDRFLRFAGEPRRLIEPGVWLGLCVAFVVGVSIPNDNGFGYFSQREGHDLVGPLVVGGLINAATFWLNAFALLPRYLEKRAYGVYAAAALGLCLASALAQSAGQSVIIALAAPSLNGVSFIDLTLRNLIMAPFVVVFSTLYKLVRDWFGHLRERGRLLDHIHHLTAELETSQQELRDRLDAQHAALRLESGKGQVQIPLADISHLKAAGNYVEVVTSGRTFLVYGQLKEMEQRLPASRFVRVHRSYVVALDRIRVVNGARLTMDGAEVTVGPAYREDFRTAWEAWTGAVDDPR